ncbi:hypothetical protein [Mesorhizobium sp.]|uniref:hypothetical protein n=1 Tax=Mesorhizobium sp. TaxID=1871066 RepID=UPI000FE6B398|nr:hypothetical protein [Mesorhizobium sp.]RWG07345.1 MAG: hypothetical protein EOQ54_04430 [Mesorhizobium sp.]RWH03738.1 MAG: hypothetical protein EOQ72_01650 [Mesorhizobium sp.]TIR93791.1 MAG: hypothetical protein E5X08_08330 [Mesorhizobium sp.]TIS02843.1 MAG: hypothetical protein E5X13_08550 [Mesorhizobium sp.]
MSDDVYVQAYRQGGVDAVNKLLRRLFPNPDDRVQALDDLEETGLWEVGDWHESSRGGIHKRDFGLVLAYLGDEGEP